MIITIVAAIARNGVIGQDNQLPWHLPADLRHFRQLTLGKPVIMGRKTFESIGKPLPGRDNIVISRQKDYEVLGARVVPSIADALNETGSAAEAMVIGGAMIYELVLPLCQRMQLTLVDADIPGDSRFPAYDAREWDEVARDHHPADAENDYDYSFITLKRRSSE